MKTAELTGSALDWAVAKCEGNPHEWCDMMIARPLSYVFRPSTDWAQGGPIIEREKINLKQRNGAWVAELEFLPGDDNHYRYGKATGPTPLVAAMRCYVASKLGDNVEVPEGLTT